MADLWQYHHYLGVKLRVFAEHVKKELGSPCDSSKTVSLGPSSVHWTWSLLELFKSLGLWKNFWQLSSVLWLSGCIYCQRAIKLKKSIANNDNCLSYLRSTKQLNLKLTLSDTKYGLCDKAPCGSEINLAPLSSWNSKSLDFPWLCGIMYQI